MILSSTSRILRTGAVAVAVVAATLALPLAPASADATFNQQMLGLVNRERAANGLAALVADPTLSANAEDAPYGGCGFTVLGRAKDMGERNYFSHTILGCLTQSVFNILNSTGLVYSGAAENIAWLNGTTDPVVAAENLHGQLMSSSAHRANILNPNFTRIGIGSWRTSPGQTWSGGGYPLTNVFIGVQIFAGGAVSPTTTTVPPTTTTPTTTTPTTTTPTTTTPTTTTPTTTTPTTTPPAVTAGRYSPLAPSRILDTRVGTGGIVGPVGPGVAVDVQVAGRGGVPLTGVSAVVMNVTVTQPTAQGYMTLYPSGTALPFASNLGFTPGQTVPNLVVVKVGANGKVATYNSAGNTHVIFDVAGWYSGSTEGNDGRHRALVPTRILDTRNGMGGGIRLGGGATLQLQVTGRGGVPATGVGAVELNVVSTETTATSFVSVYPTGSPLPLVSNLNFNAGETVSNRVITKLGSGGRVTIFNLAGGTDIVVDVGGWYTDASAPGTLGTYVPLVPSRILDTRDGTGGVGGVRPAGGAVAVQVTGRGGVPASGVTAVILNVTVTQPSAAGFLTVFPAGGVLPLAADVTFAAGETRPNLAVVQVGAGGMVTVYVSAQAHVIFDVAGWFS